MEPYVVNKSFVSPLLHILFDDLKWLRSVLNHVKQFSLLRKSEETCIELSKHYKQCEIIDNINFVRKGSFIFFQEISFEKNKIVATLTYNVPYTFDPRKLEENLRDLINKVSDGSIYLSPGEANLVGIALEYRKSEVHVEITIAIYLAGNRYSTTIKIISIWETSQHYVPILDILHKIEKHWNVIDIEVRENDEREPNVFWIRIE